MNEIEYLKWLSSDIGKKHSYLRPFAKCLNQTLDKMKNEDIHLHYSRGLDDINVLKVCAKMSPELEDLYDNEFIDEVFCALENKVNIMH